MKRVKKKASVRAAFRKVRMVVAGRKVKAVVAYKTFRVVKGELRPLFWNKGIVIPEGQIIMAPAPEMPRPSPGYKPGWHANATVAGAMYYFDRTDTPPCTMREVRLLLDKSTVFGYNEVQGGVCLSEVSARAMIVLPGIVRRSVEAKVHVDTKTAFLYEAKAVGRKGRVLIIGYNREWAEVYRQVCWPSEATGLKGEWISEMERWKAMQEHKKMRRRG